MKNVFASAVVAACVAVAASWAVVKNAAESDPSIAWLAANRAKVEKMVFADVEKYGVDVYRLYMEVSQMLPGMPDANFAGDKAIKKLQVTYPDSNVRRLADAFVAYGAIRKRDMLQIEQYLENAEKDAGGLHQLMPNGFEIAPQLVVAQYNYYFHVGKFDEAANTLDYVATAFADSWLFQPQGRPVGMLDFVASQRRILAAVLKKEGK